MLKGQNKPRRKGKEEQELPAVFYKEMKLGPSVFEWNPVHNGIERPSTNNNKKNPEPIPFSLKLS